MKLLLDTCSFLWIVADAAELSARARDLFTDPDNDVFLSSVSAWEIAVKHELGKLPLPEPPERFVPEQRHAHGIARLSIEEEATLAVHRLPAVHRDPFDRMLVGQAIAGGLVLLTPDPWIGRYPVRTAW